LDFSELNLSQVLNMSSPVQRPYLDQLRAHLPEVYLADIDRVYSQDNDARTIELVLAFALGASCPTDAPRLPSSTWTQAQMGFRSAVSGHAKRPLEEADTQGETSQSSSKKAKLDENLSTDTAAYVLFSVSASAPVRKKVDVVVTASAVKLCPPTKSPSSPSYETPYVSIPLSDIKRVFLLPTRGKTKSHWTLVLLTSDEAPEALKGKAKAAAAATAAPEQEREIVFGIDADASSAISYANFALGETPQTIPKGQPTLPALEALLQHVPISAIRPSAVVLRGTSASSSTKSRPSTTSTKNSGHDDTLAGVDAHRGTKSGSLWFLETGLLWTDVRPAEFWALPNILPAPDGVRVLSATGRSCSLFVTRRASSSSSAANGENGEDDDDNMEEQPEGVETEFALIDGKEQDAINGWIKRFNPLLGRSSEQSAESGPSKADKGKGPATVTPIAPTQAGPTTILNADWDDDDDDDDFQGSDDDNDQASGEEEEENDTGSDTGDSDAEDSDSGASGEKDGSEDEESDEDRAALDPAHHPLLRPGAMPKRVSKAVIDMVAGIVTEDLMGGEDEDELDDEEE
jgi:hypothetical protein